MGMSIVFDVDSEKLWNKKPKKAAKDAVEKIGYCGFIKPDTKPEKASSSSYEENAMTSTKQMVVMIAVGLIISLIIITCVYWYERSSNKVLNYNEYTPIYDRA